MPHSTRPPHFFNAAPDINAEHFIYPLAHDIDQQYSNYMHSLKRTPIPAYISSIDLSSEIVKSPSHWSNSELGAFEPDISIATPLGNAWSSYSQSNSGQDYVPTDESSNYLTWPYEVSDINPSLYAPSASPHPASPSMSIMSASTEDSSLQSPPSSLMEFANAFDFDYGSLPNEMQASTSGQWLQVPNQYSQPPHHQMHQTFQASSSSSPATSSMNVEGAETRGAHSREPSPSQSDNDASNPRRRYPCLILGCTRRFTSQYTLKVHMEAHKPKPRVSYPCTLGCSEKFSRQHDRLRHEVAKHGKVCEFSCDACGRFFSTKKTLSNHKCPVAQGTRWVDDS